jgi:hypothetical protein
MINKFNQLIGNIKDETDTLESEIDDLNNFPDIINVIHNVAEPNIITVVLDKPLPVDCELVIRDVNTGNNQEGDFSWDNDICTVTLIEPLINPYLPVIIKSQQYLTIRNSTSVTPVWDTPGSPIEYRLGNGDWTPTTSRAVITTDNEDISFRGEGRTSLFTFTGSANRWEIGDDPGYTDVIIDGNINSVLDYKSDVHTHSDYCFCYMFYNVRVKTANISFHATTVGKHAYRAMFYYCDELTTGPTLLPATSLDESCYHSMFADCYRLTNIPSLPATVLADNCYAYMFNGCAAITTAQSVLPATVLKPYCYQQMYSGCTSLVTAPTILATTVAEWCCERMFLNCNALLNPSSLPATTLSDNCYREMYYDCNNLLNAPDLPATTLADSCYFGMYFYCVGLTKAPSLPAVTLAVSCYQQMFLNCDALVEAPDLPATSLVDNCYTNMFTSCYALTDAPNADVYTTYTPAQADMFDGDMNLETPLMYCQIPESFGGEGGCNFVEFLNTTSIKPIYNTSGSKLQFTINTEDWWDVTSGDTLNTGGNFIRFRGTGRTSLFTGSSTNNAWVIQGTNVKVRGNFNCLLDYQNPGLSIGNYAFSYMLSNNSGITSVSAKLPSTVLADTCYDGMFSDCNNLINIPDLPATVLANNCYHNMFGNCTKLVDAPVLPATTLATSCYDTMFSGCSNLATAPSLSASTLMTSCYQSMFRGCTSLTAAPNLPATALASQCYSWMFSNCSNLVTPPALSVNTLMSGCYNGMFYNCTSLVTAPNLPATTLVSTCYNSMFSGCNNLITAPNADVYTTYTPAQADMFTGAIKVETPISYCEIPSSFGGGGGLCNYFEMTNTTSVTPKFTTTGSSFEYSIDKGSSWISATSDNTITTGVPIRFRGTGRTSLFTTANVSNQWVVNGDNVHIRGNFNVLLDYNETLTSVGVAAFAYMFYSCSNIIDVSARLPATTVADSSYYNLFNGTNITTAPDLPATTLGNLCYGYMFKSCGNLTNTPDLPATTLATSCYTGMFWSCGKITTPPALPATTVTQKCYMNMFSSCGSLTEGPDLPATTLATDCYATMFGTCGNLTTVPGADRYIQYGPTQYDMFTGATKIESPILFCEIPPDWGGPDNSPCDFLELLNTLSVTPKFTTTGSSFEYSITAGDTWLSATSGTTISTGVPIKFRGTGRSSLYTSSTDSNSWGIEGTNVVIRGNFNALLDHNNMPDTVGNYAFSYMFSHNNNIIKVPAILPADSLGQQCYEYMFWSCTALITAPALPAITLANNCYNHMFDGCNKLIDAPALPATNLNDYCYQYMFQDCTSLVNVPSLSATNALAFSCSYMFNGCTGIIAVPTLSATYLANNCYEYMFNGCTSLVNIPSILPATTLANNCYQYMFNGCSSIVIAPALPATTISTYAYAHMFQNCTSLINGPMTLPATTLATYCYTYMFSGCTSLVNIPSILPATTLPVYCYTYMFDGCASLITAPNLPATTLVNYNYFSMFSNCSNLLTAPNADVYTTYSPSQTQMFTGCTKLENPLIYCEIPTSFGGPGVCKFLELLNTSSVTPKFTVNGQSFEYSIDNGITWLPSTSGDSITTNTPIRFRGKGRTGLFMVDDPSNAWIVNGTNVSIRGNFDALLDYDTMPLSIATTAFAYMFYNNTNITNVTANLPATLLDINCYESMFSGCTGLVTAPSLPAVTLAQKCYNNMFRGCTSLITAPDLPAPSLTIDCYNNMFNGCINLTTVPSADIYTTKSPAQAGMFTNCVKIGYPLAYCEIPLSFGGSDSGCDFLEFINTTSITPTYTTTGTSFKYSFDNGDTWVSVDSGTNIATNKPIRFRGSGRSALYNTSAQNPWTVEGEDVIIRGNFNALLDYNTIPLSISQTAFIYMLYHNSSITKVLAKLPATTLGIYCYYAMFDNCDGLTVAPALPATTLADHCYSYMFYDCDTLTVAPDLPATTLAPYCYQYMFTDCSALINAPALPATTLVNSCYSNMFSYCDALVNGPDLPAITLATECYYYMFLGCTELVNTPSSDTYTRNILHQEGMFKDCTKIENPLLYCEIPTTFGGPDNDCNFFEMVNTTSVTPKFTTTGTSFEYSLDKGSTWISVNSGTSITTNVPVRFRGAGRTSLFTDVITYVDNAWTVNGSNIIVRGNFNVLLDYNNIPDTVGNYAFAYMLYNCIDIVRVTAELPATTLAASCYMGMFDGCSSMSIVPILPATNIADSCYYGMYMNCASLVNVPNLPATNLVADCYDWMFAYCTSLITAPALPATTLADHCYMQMFYGCTSLLNAPVLPATTLTGSCYYNMFSGCTSLVTGPNLPATYMQLEFDCYAYMFNGCINLITAPNADNYTQSGLVQTGMFTGCTVLAHPITYADVPDGWK